MDILRTNKTIAGNIALVLVLALFCSVAFGAVGTDVAEASDVTVEVDGVPTSSANPHSVDWVDRDDEIPIRLFPVTSVEFETILVTVYHTGTNNTVLRDVYLSAIGRSVYDGVYRMVYANFANFGITTPGDYTINFFTIDSILASVYLELRGPVPITPAPAPAPAPADPDPDPELEEGQVAIPDDAVVVDEEADSTEITVPTEDAKAVIEETGKLVIEIPEAVDTADRAVVLAMGIIDLAIEEAADLEIRDGEVTLVIPVAALAVDEILAALGVEGAQVKIAVNTTALEVVAAIDREMPAAASEGLTRLSAVLELQLKVSIPGEDDVVIGEFIQPITVEIPYQAGAGIDERLLGVYRLADDGLSWDYVGGRIDKEKNTVSTELFSFSKYTVMEFEKVFTDINMWAEDYIEVMAARHIVKGIGDNFFAPYAHTTRAEFATMLVRALRLTKETPAEATFTDVASDRWFYGYVEAAVNAGLVQGRPDGTFGPDDLIERQEMAIMVVRALEYAGADVGLTVAQVNEQLAKFTDAAVISPWARNVVAAAVKTGIILGRPQPDGTFTFAPVDDADRAEAAVMIMRSLSRLGRL